MSKRDDPKQEGHTREWQDRARVVLDAKKDAHTEASPKQSPEQTRKSEDGEVNNDSFEQRKDDDDETFY